MLNIMARELDIIPNLKWLVKQVNNIALDKEQVSLFSSGFINNINLNPGISFMTAASNSVTFPDPALSQGGIIIIYNTGSVIFVTANGYEPIDVSFGTPLTSIQYNVFYKYYSTGSKWVGGVHY